MSCAAAWSLLLAEIEELAEATRAHVEPAELREPEAAQPGDPEGAATPGAGG